MERRSSLISVQAVGFAVGRSTKILENPVISTWFGGGGVRRTILRGCSSVSTLSLMFYRLQPIAVFHYPPSCATIRVEM